MLGSHDLHLSTGVPPLNPFLPRQLELKVHNPMETYFPFHLEDCKVWIFLCFTDFFKKETHLLKHGYRWNASFRGIEAFATARHLVKRLKAYRRPLRHQGFEKMRIGRPTSGTLVRIGDLKISKAKTNMLGFCFFWSCFSLRVSESLQNFLSGVHFEAWIPCLLRMSRGKTLSSLGRTNGFGMPWLHDSPIFGLRYGVPKAFVFVELPTSITTSILVWNLGLGIGQTKSSTGYTDLLDANPQVDVVISFSYPIYCHVFSISTPLLHSRR